MSVRHSINSVMIMDGPGFRSHGLLQTILTLFLTLQNKHATFHNL